LPWPRFARRFALRSVQPRAVQETWRRKSFQARSLYPSCRAGLRLQRSSSLRACSAASQHGTKPPARAIRKALVEPRDEGHEADAYATPAVDRNGRCFAWCFWEDGPSNDPRQATPQPPHRPPDSHQPSGSCCLLSALAICLKVTNMMANVVYLIQALSIRYMSVVITMYLSRPANHYCSDHYFTLGST
jgi:hypothetical protein